MAFSAVMEVHTGGSDTNNGGGFVTSATPSFPTDLKSINNLGTTSAPVVSSASYDFVAGDVNHWVFIRSGTNWIPGWYQIVSVDTSVSPHTATLDATVGHAVKFDSAAFGQAKGLSTVAGCVTSSYVNGTASGTWGVDYSQSDNAPFTTATGFSNDGTNTHLIHSSIGKNWIGNIVNITTAGTGFTLQRRCVNSTSGTTATMDATMGGTNLSGGGGQMGGALSSVGLAASLMASNGGLFVKSGSYTISSASTNVTNGCVSLPGSSVLCGFGTRRWDMGTAPVFTASGISSATFVSGATSGNNVINVTYDAASLSTMVGFGGVGNFYKVTANNCTSTQAISIGLSSNVAVLCKGTGNSVTTFLCSSAGASFCIGCEAYSNTAAGFGFGSSGGTCIHCLSYSNTGNGFNFSSGFLNAIYCTAKSNTVNGFLNAQNSSITVGCIAESNSGGWGFNIGTANNLGQYIENCATYNNSSGGIINTGNLMQSTTNIAYSASAFTSSTDLSLNNTASAGNSLRGHGPLGSFPGGASVGVMDVGAVQTGVGAPPTALGFWSQ